MNSLSGASSERYSIRTSSSTQNPSCESLPSSEAENPRYCYNESYAPLSQIDLQQSHASLSQFDDGLSYLPDDYFQSSSFNPFMTNLPTASTVVSHISSNPQQQPTYASLMPATHHSTMNTGNFRTSLLGPSSSTRSENCSNTFPFTENAQPLQNVLGKLTNTLPELKMSPQDPSDLLNEDYLNSQDRHSHNLHSSGRTSFDRQKRSLSNINNLLSPEYSNSSAATQGSNEKSFRGLNADDRLPTSGYKSRSKKESHNRIERRRRDYINSQIAHLGNLIPAEMYRDGDGRRNKGTVLRLSVQYITDLRHALSQSSGIHRETSLARLLIPQLLNRISILENIVKEISASNNGVINFSSESYESHLEAWKNLMESNINQTCVPSSTAFSERSPQSTPGRCLGRGRTSLGVSHGSCTDIRSLSLLEDGAHLSFSTLPSRMVSTQMQRHKTTDFVPSGQDQVFIGGSMKPEDLDGEDVYSLACGDTLAMQSKHLGNVDKFADFQNKPDETGDEFFGSCESATFDDLMQMNTDGVETLQPIECRNR